MDLSEKIVLITGASRGIGKEIALTFAKYSAFVIVAARTIEGYRGVVNQIEKDGGQALGVCLDVTDAEQIKQCVQYVINTYQRIDVLINCAGIIQYHTPVWQCTIADWDRMFEVNVRGTFLCCHEVIPHMVQRKAGIVINMGSSSARMADEDLAAYTASKWAVAGYTTSLARSVRENGIRVNGINPGWVDTDMSRAYDEAGDKEWSTPQEIAKAALYLATWAPRDMTGQFIDIFGS